MDRRTGKALKPGKSKAGAKETKRRGRRDESRLLNRDVYEALKKDILSLKLRPGATLNERAIAADAGVSRTPVREAFQALEADGLVTRYPNLGAVVTELDLRHVIEAFQIREFIESAAAGIAAKVLQETEVSELLEAFKRLSQSEPTDETITLHSQADTRTHALIARASGNSLLVSILANLNNICLRALALGTLIRFKESIPEHTRLLNAILHRDSEAAEEAMRAHLSATRQRLAEVIVNPHDSYVAIIDELGVMFDSVLDGGYAGMRAIAAAAVVNGRASEYVRQRRPQKKTAC